MNRASYQHLADVVLDLTGDYDRTHATQTVGAEVGDLTVAWELGSEHAEVLTAAMARVYQQAWAAAIASAARVVTR